jgi:glycosyltransferase involved in cell wall biosynthesis
MNVSSLHDLTIVTPTLNSGRTLRATLESIRPLVLAGAEHIVVDSNSTDNTVHLALASGARVIQCPPGNMYAAINAGMSEASGEWLTYINSDDILYSDATEAMATVHSSMGDILYGNIDIIDECGRFLFWWRSPPARCVPIAIRSYCAVYQQGTVFRRSVFGALGGFDTHYKYSADYDFFLRAALKHFRFHKFVETSVAAFRLLPTQLSQAKQAEMAKEAPMIRRRHLGTPRLREALIIRGLGFLLRNLVNIDSRILRHTRGNGRDMR